MAAEWKPYQIAAAGEIQTLADSASALATTVKETLTLANLGMSAVKLVAQLQSINPLLIALEALADEVIDEIANIKEAGYYYLLIDPYYIKNVTPEPAFTYGFEQLRNESGKRLFLAKDPNTGERIERVETPPIFPTQAQLDDESVIPALVTPRKLVAGGYNPYSDSLVDPLASISPYPKFSTKQVIEEFEKAFDDEGDVARFKKNESAPKTGTLVYDHSGDPYTGWDTTKEFGLQLYDIGTTAGENFKVERKKINDVISHGKPSIVSKSGAIAIIIAAPSFDAFTEVFNAFSKMFSDIPEFASTTGKSLADSFLEILTPNNIELKLTQVDTRYGIFVEGDILGGEKYGGLAEIVSIENSEPTIMTAQKETRMTDSLRNIVKFTEETDLNANERYYDMDITVKPIRGVDGLNSFIPGDDVYEMEKRGEGGSKTKEGKYEFSNYIIKGIGSVTKPANLRVYAKNGLIAMEKLVALPDSIPPDFGGIQMKNIIPGWGEFFQQLENFVKQLKGMISDSAAFIQDIIDMIKDVEKFLEDLVKTIEEFLEFFSVTLPSTGVYALSIKSQDGGNDGLKTAIKGASGLPELSYAAGVLFVGTEVSGVNPISLLSTFLQID